MALNRNNSDEYIAIWLAGSSHSINILKRKFSRQEIDAINIPELCEKLKSQLFEQYYNDDKPQNNDKENRITKLTRTQEKIKFSDFSRLVYGTLILHQQQVYNLLVDTKAFFETTNLQISLWNKQLKQIKCYKSSTKSQPKNSPYHELPQFIELLNEAENLANDTANDSESFEESYTYSNSRAQISINECQKLRANELKTTIREFNADLTSGVETEFEDGFGEVSEDERFFFLNTFTNKSIDQETTETYMESHTKNRKRKAPYEMMDHPMNYLCIEMNSNDNNSTRDLNLKELNNNSIFNNNCSVLANPSNPDELHSFIKFEDGECFNLTNDLNVNRQVIPTTSSLLTPNSTESNVKQHCRKTHRLLIDESIKLSRQQLETQFEKYYETLDYNIEPHPKQRSAEYLLTNFKLNKMFPHILINNQSKPTKDIVKNNYLLLVREIVGGNDDESIANQVYPRWNKPIYKRKQQKSRSVESLEFMNLSQNEKHNLLPEIFVANNNTHKKVVYDDLKSLVLYKQSVNDDDVDFTDQNNSNHKSSSICPYGIMMQLINILRLEAREEIEMGSFLKTLPSRMVAALAFRHLLDLVRDSYIIIRTKPDSIEAKTISLGPQSHKLIKKLKINKLLT